MVVHQFNQVARLPKMRLLNRELLLDVIMAMADTVTDLKNQDLTSISIHSDIWKLAFLQPVFYLLAYIPANSTTDLWNEDFGLD